MKTYTFTEAREKLATLLDEAAREGEIRIKRRNGQVFVVKIQKPRESPLDVQGVALGIGRDEILESIREGRKQFK